MTKVVYREEFDSTDFMGSWITPTPSVTSLIDDVRSEIESRLIQLQKRTCDAGHSEMAGVLVEVRLSSGPGGVAYAIEATCEVMEKK